jgi:hypothetical protein
MLETHNYTRLQVTLPLEIDNGDLQGQQHAGVTSFELCNLGRTMSKPQVLAISSTLLEG